MTTYVKPMIEKILIEELGSLYRPWHVIEVFNDLDKINRPVESVAKAYAKKIKRLKGVK